MLRQMWHGLPCELCEHPIRSDRHLVTLVDYGIKGYYHAWCWEAAPAAYFLLDYAYRSWKGGEF